MRLVVTQEFVRDGYTLGWYDPKDGEIGLLIGEETDDPEHTAARLAIQQMPESYRPEVYGGNWIWSSERAAARAMKVAKTAIAVAHSNIPVPSWAVRALAEGWKPPHGWKPKVAE